MNRFVFAAGLGALAWCLLQIIGYFMELSFSLHDAGNSGQSFLAFMGAFLSLGALMVDVGGIIAVLVAGVPKE